MGNGNRDYICELVWSKMITRIQFYSEMVNKVLTQNIRWTGMREHLINDLHEEQCEQGEPDIGSAVSKCITRSWGWANNSMCSKCHEQKGYKIISSERWPGNWKDMWWEAL